MAQRHPQHGPRSDAAVRERPDVRSPARPHRAEQPVTIDCDTCSVRDVGCADCVVSVLLGMPGPALEVGSGQLRALDALARSGLVPPLRHDAVC